MLKILSYFAHSTYQKALASIPEIEFYHIIDENNKICWDNQIPKPSNIFEISKEEALNRQKNFDLMLIHRHPTILSSYNEGFNLIPRIFTEHTHPYNDWNVSHWKENREKFIDYTVFITKSNMNAWGMREDEKNSVIYHAVDLSEFPTYTGGEQSIITVCNEFPNRDWCCGYLLWANTTWGLKDVRVYGHGNENMGEACKGEMPNNEIKKILSMAGVSFNSSLKSPLPLAVLETLAVGTPLVSTNTCALKDILQDGINALVANNSVDLRQKIIQILKDPEKAKKIGERGKQLVKEMFTPQRFIYKWKKVFEKVVR